MSKLNEQEERELAAFNAALTAAVQQFFGLSDPEPTEHLHICGIEEHPEWPDTVVFMSAGCGKSWTHIGAPGPATPERLAAHMCPHCGAGPWGLIADQEDLNFVAAYFNTE